MELWKSAKLMYTSWWLLRE